MGDKNSHSMWIPTTLCVLLALLGIAYAFTLRFFGLISTEPAFLGFTCFFILTAIVVYTLPQLKELAWGGWKLTLHEAEKRIYAKEQIVRELTLTLADLALLDTLKVGQVAERLKSGRVGDAIREWRKKNIDKILSLVEATEEQEKHLTRYVSIFDSIEDSYKPPDDPEERKKIVEKLIEQLWKDTDRIDESLRRSRRKINSERGANN